MRGVAETLATSAARPGGVRVEGDDVHCRSPPRSRFRDVASARSSRARVARSRARGRDARRPNGAPARDVRGSPKWGPRECCLRGGGLPARWPRVRARRWVLRRGCCADVDLDLASGLLCLGRRGPYVDSSRLPRRASRAALRDNRRASRTTDSVPGPGCWRTAGPLRSRDRVHARAKSGLNWRSC